MRTTLFYSAALLAMSFIGQVDAVHVGPAEVYQAIEYSQTDAIADSDLDSLTEEMTHTEFTEYWRKEAYAKLNNELKEAIMDILLNAEEYDSNWRNFLKNLAKKAPGDQQYYE